MGKSQNVGVQLLLSGRSILLPRVLSAGISLLFGRFAMRVADRCPYIHGRRLIAAGFL